MPTLSILLHFHADIFRREELICYMQHVPMTRQLSFVYEQSLDVIYSRTSLSLLMQIMGENKFPRTFRYTELYTNEGIQNLGKSIFLDSEFQSLRFFGGQITWLPSLTLDSQLGVSPFTRCRGSFPDPGDQDSKFGASSKLSGSFEPLT